MNNTTISTHLNNLGLTPLLTLEEERALTEAVHHAQDLKKQLVSDTLPVEQHELAHTLIHQAETAQQQLITSNLRLVVSIAKSFYGYSHDFHDLIQEGTLGLIRATESFDPNRGTRFTTYATAWIRKYIIEALESRDRYIRHTPYITNQIRKVNQAAEELRQQNNATPTPEDIATHLGPSWTAQQVRNMITVHATGHVGTISQLVRYADGEVPLQDIIPDTASTSVLETLEEQQLEAQLQEALSGLTRTELLVLKLHYGLGNTPALDLPDISITFGHNYPDQIKRIHNSALKKLRVSSEHLRAFLQS